MQAAVALANEEGLDAVTMREIGTRLGVEAMSLYRHIANKSALLDAAAESVWSAVEIAEPEMPWRDGIRLMVRSAHRELLAHAWVLDIIDSTGGAPRFTLMDALLGCLARAGLSEHDVFEGYHLIDALLIGYTLQQRNYADLSSATIERQIASIPRGLVHLDAHVAQHDRIDDPASGIDLGLDLLLDSLQRRIASR